VGERRALGFDEDGDGVCIDANEWGGRRLVTFDGSLRRECSLCLADRFAPRLAIAEPLASQVLDVTARGVDAPAHRGSTLRQAPPFHPARSSVLAFGVCGSDASSR
jgi:hypothetical protein